MNIPIPIFGGDSFLAKLPKDIQDASSFSVELISNFNQAISRIQLTPPDVILVQASWDDSMKLCHWLKEQTKLSWIYCILIEDRPQLLALKNTSSEDWELEMTSSALQQGADAYIWSVETRGEESRQEEMASHRLLLAHLNVGLRKAQKYRELMRKNDLLSVIALADSLTELKNRRALECDLPNQIKKAQSHGTPLSLIILDVDFFKKVNDTYGHLVGDRLLQLLCSRLRHNLRFQDIPFRYGGEEFVIVLPNTNCDEAFSVANRLNSIISKEPFAINNKLSLNITISLGTSCLQAEDDAKGVSLLQRADQYLLEAKATGRNRVVGCTSHTLHHVPQRQTVSFFS
ncbi:diguanylate cyclase [Scytonema hofmannii PCC 7110]|uniref:Diguanylate cyclase n=1 Tax=Scytonema hofmannii PCC 7110 TaxID=128403 RepID=A0A139X573_9CYAN|nr:diguanylate cyclase [Scytonema hofmannii]KYC39840.1 diguanylate cyclase [Scytonema hofmannii PCC 7110]